MNLHGCGLFIIVGSVHIGLMLGEVSSFIIVGPLIP
jgi:hypothetical protein